MLALIFIKKLSGVCVCCDVVLKSGGSGAYIHTDKYSSRPLSGGENVIKYGIDVSRASMNPR